MGSSKDFTPQFSSSDEEIAYLKRKILFLTQHAEGIAHDQITRSNRLTRDLRRDLAERERDVWLQGLELEKRNQEIEKRKEELGEKERDLWLLGMELEKRDAEIEKQDAEIDRQGAEISGRDATLEQRNQELDEQKERAGLLIRELADIKNSTSWKVTRPLRGAGRLLGRRGGKP